MVFEKEIEKIKKNIYISKGISKFPGKTGAYREYITYFGIKYGENVVREALIKMYNSVKKDVPDIKGLTAAYIIRESKLQKRGA
ncbi:MAG: hypothetical protein RR523_01700 [Cetobacterium sp.]|uniref:hypothetical protein n=1 Tax=Cetobacterium sp. TaxID=2071632 RepID=UPI002FCA72E0